MHKVFKIIYHCLLDKRTTTEQYGTKKKHIWKESSLKALICLWQEEGIVRSDAMIKAKTMGGSEKTYPLDDLCNKKQLLDTIEDDILNPCGINDGLWDSSF